MPPTKMATCTLFEEDEVFVHKPGKGYQFGLILENSEFFSSEDEDESERPEDRLKRGSVRIAWYPTGKETVVAENKVVLADRSLMPGDVVRRLIPGQESQSGFIMDMDVKCQLHVKRTNKYIYNVNSRDLEPLLKFESGQDVMLDSWLGKVEAVNLDVILLFPDGARCQVDESDLYGFDDVSDKVERHGEFGVYLSYPGQELKGPLEHLCDGKWLHSTPRYCHKIACKKGRSNVHVTVEKTIVRSVEVHWVFRGFEVTEDDASPPKQPPGFVCDDQLERLQVLDWFEHCSIQIADRMVYRVKQDDCISTVEPNQAFNPSGVTDISLSLVQNGACSTETASKPVESKDDQEIQAQDSDVIVLNEDDDCEYEDVDEDSEFEGEKIGTSQNKCAGGRGAKKKKSGLKSLGAKYKTGKLSQKGAAGGPNRKRPSKERTVNPDDLVEVEVVFTNSWAAVMWQDGSMETDIPSVELFPVHHIDELELFPGDFVLPDVDMDIKPDYGVVVKTDHHERTSIVHWFKAFDVSKEREPTLLQENCEMSVYDIKDHPDYKFRPGQCIVRVSGFEHIEMDSDKKGLGVGQVIKLDPNGRLVVKWSNGSISQCFPQEIFIISDDSDDMSNNESWESESDEHSGSSSAETWETESEQEIVGEEDESKLDEDSENKLNSSSFAEHKQELDSLLARAQTALVRLQSLLNSFDISASAPECFHDILRIYRNCHDLDKILQSSFFSDSELQSLIAQAKLEIKRDKTNKISKHLSQLFESWSKATPNSNDCRNFGTLAVGDKTIKVGTNNLGTMLKVTIEVPSDVAGSGQFENGEKHPNESSSTNCDFAAVAASSSAQPEEAEWEGRALRKEFSEPVINQLCRNGDLGSRRPSDPVVDVAGIGAKNKSKPERNLVGENCVGKAPKRTKSDASDDNGRDVKKSREDGQMKPHVAQELCTKICQNLQRQIFKIHEEVKKRTQRLVSSENGNSDEGVVSGVAASLPAAEVTKDLNPLIGEPVPDDTQYTKCAFGDVKDTRTANEESSSSSYPQSSSTAGEYICENGMKEEPQKENNICEPDVISSKTPSDENSAGTDNVSSIQEDESVDEPVKAIPCEGFTLQEEVDSCHKFSKQANQPSNPRSFRNAVRKEMNLFRTSLPKGIFVKGFEDRLDLYSVMILGPCGTPYEDALFLFDLMLPNDYPNSPPVCHYHSYCSERLNPNLYEDGKVCVSLLGTWSGKGTEMWTTKSNLLQVLLSIQGLILVPEPYYNEAGYERQRGTQVGLENSRVYNEMAIIKTVQSLTKMCKKPPTLFQAEVCNYLLQHGPGMIARLQKWMDINQPEQDHLIQESPPAGDVVSSACEEKSATCETVLAYDLSSARDKYPHMSESPKPDTSPTKSNSSQCSSTPAPIEGTEALVMDKFSKLLVSGEESTSKMEIVNSSTEDTGDKCACIRPPPPAPGNGETSSPSDPNLFTGNVSGAVGGSSVPEHSSGSEKASPPNCPQDESSNVKTESPSQFSKPDFPLLPMSRGFRLTLQKVLNSYGQALKQLKDLQSTFNACENS